MEKMENQLLRNPSIEPTDNIIAEGLGNSYQVFIKFIAGLKEYEITLMEWQYYNDGKSWLSKGEYKWTTPRGNSKVKTIFWLSIWEGFLKISIFFPTIIKEELLNLKISQEAKLLIKNAKPMGKLKFIPLVFNVKNDTQLSDIYELAQFRKLR